MMKEAQKRAEAENRTLAGLIRHAIALYLKEVLK